MKIIVFGQFRKCGGVFFRKRGFQRELADIVEQPGAVCIIGLWIVQMDCDRFRDDGAEQGVLPVLLDELAAFVVIA